MGSTCSSSTSLKTRLAMTRETDDCAGKRAETAREHPQRRGEHHDPRLRHPKAEQQPHDDGRGKADESSARLAVCLLEFFFVRHRVQSPVPFASDTSSCPASRGEKYSRARCRLRCVQSQLGTIARHSCTAVDYESVTPKSARGETTYCRFAPFRARGRRDYPRTWPGRPPFSRRSPARARPSRSACPQATRTCRWCRGQSTRRWCCRHSRRRTCAAADRHRACAFWPRCGHRRRARR